MKGDTLLLGLGNPLLGDDGIGIRLVRQLRTQLTHIPHLSFRVTSQSGLYLLDSLLNFKQVIILDALLDADRPVGSIKKLKLQPGTATGITGASPHFIGIHSLLELGKYYGLPMPQSLIVLGIVIHDGGLISPNLSVAMQCEFNTLLHKISRQINSICANCN